VVGLARGALEVQAKEVAEAPSQRTWTHERCLVLRCDVRIKSQVEVAVKRTIERFGHLDIVCKSPPRFIEGRLIGSCAGWGILGACEEQTDSEIRSQFETNVYGTFNVIRQTLPLLRGRETARYINLSSTSMFLGYWVS
jgi:NAD(P)-dependent dehydrogenase (short-subunit alcohol dehydrogenase family)